MTDFGAELRRLIAERGLSLRVTARQVPCDSGYLSRVAAGRKRPSPQLAARLDDLLCGDGKLRTVTPARPERRPARARSARSGAVEALQVAMTGDPDGPDIGAEGLAELVRHYAHAIAVEPSAAVYRELLSARSFAGTLLSGSTPGKRTDLTVTTGWLSSLLAVSATNLGDHAAAVVWCADTERRGRDAGYPELIGWASFTRALIAWYQGDPLRSAAEAARGQASGQPGSVAHAKLAAHEMRSRAMLGDTAGMADARRRATVAMAQIRTATFLPGMYSLPRAEEPPYTATSLLLTGQYADAAEMTRGLLEAVYRPQERASGDQPTNYARTLLILALAAAGLGDLHEAVTVGTAALDCGRVVWPTMVLAAKLDKSLTGQFPSDMRTADFHARYIDTHDHLALAAPPFQPGESA